MSIFSSFATTAARKTLNSTWLAPYGSLTQLEIDSQKRTLAVTLDLKGESQPIQIVVKRYELIQRGEDTFLKLEEIETSREWLNSLLRDHLIDKVINPRLQQTPLPAVVKLLL